jgi:hypothetical protein
MEESKTKEKHKHFFYRQKIFWVLFLLIIFAKFVNAQELRPKPTPSPTLSCVIRVDHDHWKKNQPAIIRGYIVNLTDRGQKLSVLTTIHLTQVIKNGTLAPGRYCFWSAVNLLRDEPLDINGRERLIINKRGKVDFVLDANILKWDSCISSVWPCKSLSAAVNTGVYFLSVGIGSIAQSNSVRVVLE